MRGKRSACSAGCNAEMRMGKRDARNSVNTQCSNQRLTVIAKNEARKSQIIQNYSSVETPEKKKEKNSGAHFLDFFQRKRIAYLWISPPNGSSCRISSERCIEV
jgi:hypothetical protein